MKGDNARFNALPIHSPQGQRKVIQMSVQESLRPPKSKRKRITRKKTPERKTRSSALISRLRRMALGTPFSRISKREVPINKERENCSRSIRQEQHSHSRPAKKELEMKAKPRRAFHLRLSPPCQLPMRKRCQDEEQESCLLPKAYEHDSSKFGWNPIEKQKDESCENDLKCETPRGVALAIFERTKWEYWENLGWDLDPSREGWESGWGKKNAR